MAPTGAMSPCGASRSRRWSARYLGIDPSLVDRAFLITAVTFGATSLAGYVTKRDLSGFGAFFMMASIGIIIAMLVECVLRPEHDVQPHHLGASPSCCSPASPPTKRRRSRRCMSRAMRRAWQGQVDLRSLHALRQLHHAVHPHPEHPRHHAQQRLTRPLQSKSPGPKRCPGFLLPDEKDTARYVRIGTSAQRGGGSLPRQVPGGAVKCRLRSRRSVRRARE